MNETAAEIQRAKARRWKQELADRITSVEWYVEHIALHLTDDPTLAREYLQKAVVQLEKIRNIDYPEE